MSPAPYVVYAHYFRGKPYYVGCGMRHRPHETSNRNWAWFRVFRPGGLLPRRIDVRVLSKHTLLSDAREREKYLIRKWRPKCNVLGLANTSKKRQRLGAELKKIEAQLISENKRLYA